MNINVNPTQLYTVTFGMMSIQMSKKLENLDNHKEREELFFNFMNDINETQAKALEEYYINLNSEDKDEFWEDIYEDGIYFHQPPFYDNIEFDQLSEVMHKYDIEPFKFKGIENKMVMGDLYFVLLKHTASSKFSARSVAYNNIKNIPAKSKAFKENENLYRKNPLRLG
jgi:hypothetical protein